MEFQKHSEDKTEKSVEFDNSMTVKQEKWRIIKNVMVISFAFMLGFTAFQSMSALQSSINQVHGLGTYSNVAIYAASIISAILLPSFVIKHLTVKWTLTCSLFSYTVYICTNFYPTFYTIVPGGAIVGLAAGPLWTSKCTYLKQVAARYATILDVKLETITARFFGIFFFFNSSSFILGNLISSLILTKDDDGSEPNTDFSTCGTNYCPDSSLPDDTTPVSNTAIFTLAGVYLALSVMAWVLMAVFVDPLSKFVSPDKVDSEGKKVEEKSTFTLINATLKQMIKPDQLLIIPITLWSGMEQGFFFGDFTAGYISCAYGVDMVGWILLVFGAAGVIAAFFFGTIIKLTGRIPIYMLGASINYGVIVVLWLVDSYQDSKWLFYLLAALWGIADAHWRAQINTIYGLLFPSDPEAAFSNYWLWRSVGFVIAFVLQVQVCIEAKLYALVLCLSLGMLGYFIIEWKQRKNEKK